MTLVFITRKVDRGDALTGFVFTWITKLANQLADTRRSDASGNTQKNAEEHPRGSAFREADHQRESATGEAGKLYVICQEKGDTSGLPANVEVHSFGKEKGYGKLRQGYLLFVTCLKLARRANGFFVHMHPIYAIIAWLPAKLLGKKIVFWYTHKSVDFKLRVAHALVDRVLTASQESFRLPSNKVKVVGHGIDISKFQIPSTKSQINSKSQITKFRIVSVGRISPVKDYETLIKAVEILVNHKNVKDIDVEIYGRIGLPEHQAYLDSLVTFVHNADLEDIVKFQGELNYEYVDEAYQEADLFVNLSGTGSIDKSVLEAAACGTLVISSNEAFQKSLQNISPLFFFERDQPEDLASKILKIKDMNPEQRQALGERLRGWVYEDHNLDNLVKRILVEFNQPPLHLPLAKGEKERG